MRQWGGPRPAPHSKLKTQRINTIRGGGSHAGTPAAAAAATVHCPAAAAAAQQPRRRRRHRSPRLPCLNEHTFSSSTRLAASLDVAPATAGVQYTCTATAVHLQLSRRGEVALRLAAPERRVQLDVGRPHPDQLPASFPAEQHALDLVPADAGGPARALLLVAHH